MKKILLIDDETEMLESLEKILSHRNEFEITALNDSTEAINILKTKKFDLVITDLKMKPVNGLDILKSALNYNPLSVVIMISGYGTIEASVEAMRFGAFDFIEKPFTSKTLFECIDRAFENSPESAAADNNSEPMPEFSNIIYKSKEMAKVIDLVKKVAQGNLNILITGESGTGKELIARAIHNLSKRKENPFVPINCGALPEHLFESELFGHERGAFTGAVKTKPGLLEFANQGTFFFDEIGDMSQLLQVKLLRMLEERKIRRVGGQSEIEIDVRIIAATNKNIEHAVLENKFREDLFYRLNTIRIEVPPLRERIEDILPLANHFMSDLCKMEDNAVRNFSPEAQEILKSYPWPGNVRELQNIIGRAYFLSSSKIIQKSDLPISIKANGKNISEEFLIPRYKEAKEIIIEKFEVEYLTHHLRINKGNITKTAESCGIDRRSIHRLINKYNIIYREDDQG